MTRKTRYRQDMDGQTSSDFDHTSNSSAALYRGLESDTAEQVYALWTSSYDAWANSYDPGSAQRWETPKTLYDNIVVPHFGHGRQKVSLIVPAYCESHRIVRSNPVGQAVPARVSFQS